ncbi:hypothetical protein Bbelb_264610 [Branchiostoma belcheri]|nr:hypothetical protein Bbelb_264610 [Branchiostoma belcheri]
MSSPKDVHPLRWLPQHRITANRLPIIGTACPRLGLSTLMDKTSIKRQGQKEQRQMPDYSYGEEWLRLYPGYGVTRSTCQSLKPWLFTVRFSRRHGARAEERVRGAACIRPPDIPSEQRDR